MNSDLISIIVPVYNTKEYLSKCVNSILSQTYSNIELILVDDGSTDGSGKMCDQFAQSDRRVKVIHKENGGQASARNMALDVMAGEYVGFVDSDDYILPDMYESLYNAIHEYGADMAICGFSRDHIFIKQQCEIFDKPFTYDTEEIILHTLTPPFLTGIIWNKLYKVELWQNVRFPLVRAREDIAVLHRVYANCKKAVHIGISKYIQFVRPGSTEESGFREDKLASINAARDHADFVCEKFPQLSAYTELKLANVYYSEMRATIIYYGLKKYRHVYDNMLKGLEHELETHKLHSEVNDARYKELKWAVENQRALMRECRIFKIKHNIVMLMQKIFMLFGKTN